jgi:alpha-1,6-mannosyltransferase
MLTAEAVADGEAPAPAGPGPTVAPGPEDDLRAIVHRIGKPAAWGLLASMAITYGASQLGSPFALKAPGAWFFGIPSITTPPGPKVLLSLVSSYGGMLLLLRAWFDMVRAVSPTRAGGRPVPLAALAVVAALWMIPVLVAPPLFSQDVYSYAAQGQMVTQGINPYVHGPDALGPNSPYYQLVDRLWGASPAPYGPVFIGLDAAINTVTGHHVLAAVVGLRLLALLGVVLIAIGLPVIARSMRRDAGTVFALAVLNPVTLLHLLGGAHNDALMLGLLVAGMALALKQRPLWAVTLCALAAAVKVPAALGVVYVGWHWLGPRATWRERVRPLLTALLTAGGLMAVVTAASGLGWGWARALDNPSVVRSVLDPVTALGMLLGTATHALHLPIGVKGMLTVTRGLGLTAAMVAGLGLLLSSNRLGMVKALGTTLLLVVVLGPVVQPWYLAWGIVLLAPVAFGRWRLVVLGVTIVGSFIGFPGGVLLVQELGRSSLWSVAVALAVLLAVPLPPIITRIRQVLAAGRVAGAPPTRSVIDEALHQDHVEPLAELAADLPLHPHQLEPAGPVEPDRGLVAAHDPGHDGMEAVGLGQADQLG